LKDSVVFQNILLPVDLSNRHGKALKIAAGLALQSGGEVSVFHVIELLQGTSQQEEAAFYRRLEAKARAHLEQLQAQLKEQGVRAKTLLVYGDRAAQIVRYAVEADSDLIVLSSHRVSFEDPGLTWSTLSYKVGILAQCPVLLVK
jgi:nucleotide-binding universal stress UspA family protein